MTSAGNEKLSSWERRVTVNISIPLKVLAAIDDRVEPGKRSEFITSILLKDLNL